MEPTVPTPERKPGAYQGTPQSLQQKNGEDPSPRLIHTMKSDVAEAIKKQNETFVSIALAEERKQLQKRGEELTARANAPQQAPKPRGRTVIIVIFLLLAVALGLAYQFILPMFSTTPSSGTPVEKSSFPASEKTDGMGSNVPSFAPALIPPQYEKRFILNKETPEYLFATIAVERAAGVASGSIKNLYFTEETKNTEGVTTFPVVSAQKLIAFAKIDAPEILMRSLEDQFMAGLLGESDSTATPFLILKVSSYDTGLAGMLAGEGALVRFFDTVFGTKIQTRAFGEVKFRDIVILGKDARMLAVAPGVAIAYSFADPNTIVITGSRSALEILIPAVSK